MGTLGNRRGGLSARLLAVCKPSELIRGGRRPGAAVPVAAMLPLGRKVRHARPGPRRTISRSGSRTESRNVPSTSAWLRDEAYPRGGRTEIERTDDRRTEAWRRASGIAPCWAGAAHSPTEAKAEKQYGPAMTGLTAIAKLAVLWVDRAENINGNYAISDKTGGDACNRFPQHRRSRNRQLCALPVRVPMEDLDSM